jgi:cysteinyl-tRNA synthetase
MRENSMSNIDYDAQIKFQEQKLSDVVYLKNKLEGAIEILKLLKAEAEKEVAKVEETAKAVEAEIIQEVKKI